MEYEYDRSRYFDIPKYFYFTAGNNTTGSLNTFNYRVDPVPDKEEPVNSKLRARVWYGMLCSELCEPEAENDFEFSEDGYRKMVYWIDEQLDEYKRKLAAGEVEGRRTFSGDI